MRAVFEPQEFSDFVEAKPEALRRLYETEALNVRGAITPYGSIWLWWLWYQPPALVEPNGFHADNCEGRQLPDGEIVGVSVQANLRI